MMLRGALVSRSLFTQHSRSASTCLCIFLLACCGEPCYFALEMKALIPQQHGRPPRLKLSDILVHPFKKRGDRSQVEWQNRLVL